MILPLATHLSSLFIWKCLYFCHIWRTVLLCIRSLVAYVFSPLACWMWPPLAASGLQVFVWRLVCYVSLTALISSMCAESFFLDTFSIFSLSFNSLITICLGNILVLFVFRTHWIFMSFIRSGSFIHYSPKYFSAPTLPFPRRLLYMSWHVWCLTGLWSAAYIFQLIFFLCIKWCLLPSFTVRFFYHPNLLSPSTEISLQCMFNGLFPNSLWLTSEFIDLPWFHTAEVPPWVSWRGHFAMFWANSTLKPDRPVPTDFSHRPYFASLNGFNFLVEYYAF